MLKAPQHASGLECFFFILFNACFLSHCCHLALIEMHARLWKKKKKKMMMMEKDDEMNEEGDEMKKREDGGMEAAFFS